MESLKSLLTTIINFFGIDNNTSATIIITLSVFILGFAVKGFIDIIRNFANRYKYRRFFSSLITSISKASLKQSKYFEESANRYHIEHIGNFYLKSSIITHLANVDKIDINRLYEAYFSGFENTFTSKKKVKAYEKIWAYVAQLTKIEERYPNQVFDFIQRFNDLEDNRNNSIEEFRKAWDDLLFKTRNNPENAKQEEYVKEISVIMNEWSEIDISQRTHYYTVSEKIVQPIRKLNKKYQDIEATLVINNHLINSEHFYINMQSLLNVNHEIFKSYFHFYKTSGKVLQVCIKILSFAFLPTFHIF